MKLEEFVTSEVESIMAFSAVWRERNLKDKEKFPLEISDWAWFKYYLAYCAKQIEEQSQKNNDAEKDAA